MSDNSLLNTLRYMRELEEFLFSLLKGLSREKLRHGENIKPYAEKMGVRIPEFLKDVDEITWDAGKQPDLDVGEGNAIVLLRPGQPEALGFTIGCIRFPWFKVCLECGWLYCRIVIKGRF